MRRWTGIESTQDLDQNGQVPETAQGPNGAECRTALNPERREIPNVARCRRARNPRSAKRRCRSALCRRSGFRAVWDFALSGISRRLGFRAVWDFAPSGTWRRYCCVEAVDSDTTIGAVHRKWSPFHRKRPVTRVRARDRDRELLDRRRERIHRHGRHADVALAIVLGAPLTRLRIDDNVGPASAAGPSTACTCRRARECRPA